MHIVSSIGDPEQRSTWSGTPAHLVNALRERQAIGEVHQAVVPVAITTSGRVINALLGLGHRQSHRVGLEHTLLRRTATRVCATLEGVVLHFGSGHLPLLWRRPGSLHYLFIDYTVARLVQNATFQAMTPARYRDRILRIERATMHALDGVFVTSDYVRQSLIDDHGIQPDRIVVTGTGVGARDWLPMQRDDKQPLLLFVAKFNFVNKGGALLLDAFDLVRRRRPDVRLAIIGNVGDPEQRPFLERMRTTPGIEFYPADTPDYLTLLRSADLYVGPALDEPWGIIYLEAQLCATPVLMLDRNAARQFTDDGRNGYLVCEPSPAAVARVLIEALDDQPGLAARGAAARMFVQRQFSWHEAADRIIAHVNRDLKGQNR